MNVFGAFFGILGTIFNDVICYPLGLILRVSYLITGNYAISLIIFTFITRLFLFPLAIKQQRSSAEMLRMKPKMEQIQKKYAKNQAKQQEELSKLYQEEGYNPLSGCLPLLLQLPIIYGLFTVVYRPLTYIMWFQSSTITKIEQALKPFITVSLKDARIQIYVAKAMNGHMNLIPFIKNVKPIDFYLFNLDLSQKPYFGFDILVLIPILCYLTSVLSSYLNIRMTKAVQGQMGGGMNNIFMVLLMPLISAWFSLSFPAAVGFYWIITNLFMVVQVLILQKYFSIEKLAEQSKLKSEKRKQDIQEGKIKPSRMAELTKRAMDMQKQKQALASGQPAGTASPETDKTTPSESLSKPQTVKVNSKGNKSRSQLKEEQRKKLAQSRSKENGNKA